MLQRPHANMIDTDLPIGTVTFLLTDIRDSVRLWETDPDAMESALACHDQIIDHGVSRHHGMIVRPRGEGDSRFAVFARAAHAVASALAIQRALVSEPWMVSAPLQVRVAVHTGQSGWRRGDYYGSSVNRCARLRDLAHGGQILVSQATEELVRCSLPVGAELRNLGQHRLRGFYRAERVFQLVHPNLPADFPPLAGPNDRPTFLTAAEVARELRLGQERVRRLAAVGRLPAYRLDRSWIFDRDDIDTWLRGRRNGCLRQLEHPLRSRSDYC
jgi:excisionase family DNA binding protein